MPLIQGANDEREFLQVYRVFTDSIERRSGTVSDYVVALKNRILDVIAIELTSFAMPTSVTPTFLSNVNDALDFELSLGPVTKTFTARMPTNSFTYQNATVPYLDLVGVLQQTLNKAIFFDPDFGSGGTTPVFFWTQAMPEQITVIGTSGGAQLRLLFASGTNANISCASALGFTKVDHLVPAGNYIVSNFPVNLEPFNFVEVYVDELPEYKPLARIYNPASAGSVLQQDYSVTRMRWLSDAPPRFLDKLTIRIRLPNGAPIEDAYKNNHSLTFSVVALSHASEKVPAFLQSIATL